MNNVSVIFEEESSETQFRIESRHIGMSIFSIMNQHLLSADLEEDDEGNDRIVMLSNHDHTVRYGNADPRCRPRPSAILDSVQMVFGGGEMLSFRDGNQVNYLMGIDDETERYRPDASCIGMSLREMIIEFSMTTTMVVDNGEVSRVWNDRLTYISGTNGPRLDDCLIRIEDRYGHDGQAMMILHFTNGGTLVQEVLPF